LCSDGGVYREHEAPAGLACLWTREATDASSARVVPDGCTDIIWVPDTGDLFVAGPDTKPHMSSVRPGRMFGVRFPPGAGPSVFGVPAHVLRDQRVPLSELVPSAGLESAADVVAFAVDRLRPDPALGAVASALRGADVSTVAWDLGLSSRQLHRRCLDAFGYGPKMLQRVLRFDHAVALARTGVPFASVAADSGYADQAHLSREVREFAGVPLRQLIRP
jgi:AraC-like DNA-binding protein